MLLLFRAVLVLGLATLLEATRESQTVSVKMGTGPRGKGKILRLSLDPTALDQMNPITSAANMSLSPWTYRDSFVETRLPQRISHAQCLTSGCVSLQDGGEDYSLEAKPISYHALVLHRVSKRNPKKRKGKKQRRRYVFKLGLEVITVGCTCVRPTVIPQQ
ncbi:interleukin 17a/f3 [Echeneis naucrates]|uniref:Interleukin-17F-like n=1 Tax=Echeneis naucrates TaxID=173247 RepID=A0A665WBS5_ECHNA|nr:interleukin-17F-like [Echeneis naucrates]